MIFDTDVLIWFLHGNQHAKNKILEASPFKISIITYMELLQGIKNKSELASLKKVIQNLDVEIIPINNSISLNAAYYIENYFLSHSIEMSDALIAATCLDRSEILCTANDKHYNIIPNLSLDVFRP